MTDLVSVASNAVSSYQRALGTISNNIANVATDGYSRQEVVLQANPVAKVGNTHNRFRMLTQNLLQWPHWSLKIC